MGPNATITRRLNFAAILLVLSSVTNFVTYAQEQPTGLLTDSALAFDGYLLYSSVVTTDLIEQHYLAGGVGGRLEELTWEGEVVWSYEATCSIAGATPPPTAQAQRRIASFSSRTTRSGLATDLTAQATS